MTKKMPQQTQSASGIINEWNEMWKHRDCTQSTTSTTVYSRTTHTSFNPHAVLWFHTQLVCSGSKTPSVYLERCV